VFKQLLAQGVFRYHALGLARAWSLVAIAEPRSLLTAVGVATGFKALVAASKSCWAIFQLSVEVLKLEKARPGTFTRAQ